MNTTKLKTISSLCLAIGIVSLILSSLLVFTARQRYEEISHIVIHDVGFWRPELNWTINENDEYDAAKLFHIRTNDFGADKIKFSYLVVPKTSNNKTFCEEWPNLNSLLIQFQLGGDEVIIHPSNDAGYTSAEEGYEILVGCGLNPSRKVLYQGAGHQDHWNGTSPNGKDKGFITYDQGLTEALNIHFGYPNS